ncbi:hypothetical protein [Xylella fastidiosa]|uniref:hypothetical protein n=2 Tax=Xylella fastidiosa TaxID=2371 RepID=UPI001F23180E|nr:hypothetical protein [Xylella fastidiosa]MCP8325020.1 hypothetical protein [Xylella fastidiosa subsp. multiplex]MDD0908754.1 hypothetical protein [Xylella fastidiosa subsp. multiplex]MDD0928906.1 hypothetical protein [Xylella fastidiosa subsp. multiplex]UIT41654.1 hypothetical protein LZ759_02230 [Xylella fastidiosa subsp. multiplex]
MTSHLIRGDSGEPTGFAMVELTHPLEVFEAAGIPVEIASIRGGHPPIDFFDLSDPVNDRFWKNKAFRRSLTHSFSATLIRCVTRRSFLLVVTVRCGTLLTVWPCRT